jgi:hypothetical protein
MTTKKKKVLSTAASFIGQVPAAAVQQSIIEAPAQVAPPYEYPNTTSLKDTPIREPTSWSQSYSTSASGTTYTDFGPITKDCLLVSWHCSGAQWASGGVAALTTKSICGVRVVRGGRTIFYQQITMATIPAQQSLSGTCAIVLRKGDALQVVTTLDSGFTVLYSFAAICTQDFR